MLGDGLAVKLGKAAWREAIVDALLQFAIIPVLDAHENERAEHLRGSDAVASGAGVLQASLQILTHLLDEGEVLIEKCGDGSQAGVELDTLELQFKVGEAELGRAVSHQSAFLSALK